MNLTQTFMNVITGHRKQFERENLILTSTQGAIQEGKVRLVFEGRKSLEGTECTISVRNLKDVTDLNDHRFVVSVDFTSGMTSGYKNQSSNADEVITTINECIDWVTTKAQDKGLEKEFTSILESQLEE